MILNHLIRLVLRFLLGLFLALLVFLLGVQAKIPSYQNKIFLHEWYQQAKQQKHPWECKDNTGY